MEGLEFKGLSEGDFLHFARQHGTSVEIGRIGTYLDDTHDIKGEPRLFEERVLPRLEAFAPDLIMISAGFDAMRQDPIGDLRLDDPDLAWATEKIAAIAARCCEGRLVSALEGGYNPGATASACAAHVRALMAA